MGLMKKIGPCTRGSFGMVRWRRSEEVRTLWTPCLALPFPRLSSTMVSSPGCGVGARGRDVRRARIAGLKHRIDIKPAGDYKKVIYLEGQDEDRQGSRVAYDDDRINEGQLLLNPAYLRRDLGLRQNDLGAEAEATSSLRNFPTTTV
jgi:hypothetical protein